MAGCLWAYAATRLVAAYVLVSWPTAAAVLHARPLLALTPLAASDSTHSRLQQGMNINIPRIIHWARNHQISRNSACRITHSAHVLSRR